MQRIYLDHAATSFPKSPEVIAAVTRYLQENGAPYGRGGSVEALEVHRVVNQTRHYLADLFRAESGERIIFTLNGTDSLNLAIHGILFPGDHVITSCIEHNSVVRPLHYWKTVHEISITELPVDPSGFLDPEDLNSAWSPRTRLVVINHASNVFGTVQPIEEIGRIVRERGGIFLVDAAQTAGSIPIDVGKMGIDLLACPGHKGLGGPLGTGVLYIRPGIEKILRPWRQGGTGAMSESPTQPESMPDRYEAGNHNVPGLFGLHAALANQKPVCSSEVLGHLIEGLKSIPNLEVFAGPVEHNAGIASFSIPELDPHLICSLLESKFGIRTRAGLHCAPGAHRAIGTLERGGTIRASLGPSTMQEEIEALINAVTVISQELL